MTALVLQALGIVFAVQLTVTLLILGVAHARGTAARRRRAAFDTFMDEQAARLQQMRQARR